MSTVTYIEKKPWKAVKFVKNGGEGEAVRKKKKKMIFWC